MNPDNYLYLSAILFTLGALGVLIRRNAIFVFMCIELMLNASNLAFVTFSRMHGALDGQVIAFFVMVVAAVGAMVLAHQERDEPKPTQKALARARIRSGRPQPLPGPGVLSSHDAIGTPALLPDGSIAVESVMAGLPGGLEHLERPALPAAEQGDEQR